jgi:hypothetical protein
MDNYDKAFYGFLALTILGVILWTGGAYYFIKTVEADKPKILGVGITYFGVGSAVIGSIGMLASYVMGEKARKEKYAEIKKAVAAGELPPVALERPDMFIRVETAPDSRDERLVRANRCQSVYAGAFGMGAETECGRVKQNPNGF